MIENLKKFQNYIKDELNVSDVGFTTDVGKYLHFQLKPNDFELGKQYGS